jgi:hypothetical protein
MTKFKKAAINAAAIIAVAATAGASISLGSPGRFLPVLRRRGFRLSVVLLGSRSRRLFVLWYIDFRPLAGLLGRQLRGNCQRIARQTH